MTYTAMPELFRTTFAHYAVPEEMQSAFWNYFMYGWDPGSFGRAALRNDFANAVLRAHPSLSVDHLREIARWFKNTRLPDAYGSDGKIEAWQSLSNETRREIMEDLHLSPTLFSILRSVPGG